MLTTGRRISPRTMEDNGDQGYKSFYRVCIDDVLVLQFIHTLYTVVNGSFGPLPRAADLGVGGCSKG